MLVLPRQPEATMSDADVPDALVTRVMVERYLELDPPFATVNQGPPREFGVTAQFRF